jgi:hypothetical protein
MNKLQYDFDFYCYEARLRNKVASFVPEMCHENVKLKFNLFDGSKTCIGARNFLFHLALLFRR